MDDSTNPSTNPTGDTKPGFEATIQAVADDAAEALDRAVDKASSLIAGQDGNRLLGGAAVGALAAVVLPISLGVGAVLGAGYAAYRQSQK